MSARGRACECADCGQRCRNHGRGLCATCYSRWRRRPSLMSEDELTGGEWVRVGLVWRYVS